MNTTRRYAALSSAKIAYIDQGTGPVVVCLHAIAHSADDYLPFISALANQYRFIAVDFPGHGYSDEVAQPVCAHYYSEVVEALLEKLQIHSFILIGNSIGGAAAIELATRLGDRVQALILCNSGGIFERSLVARVAANAFSALFAKGEQGAGWYQTLYSWYYKLVLPNASAADRRAEITAEAYKRARVNREAWQSFARPESDVREKIKLLQIPIFIAWAKKDLVNRLQYNLPTIRSLQNSQLKTYVAGHVPFLECQTEFILDFQEFINSAPARS